MIPKIRYGTRSTYGLVRYLFGAGKRDEHTDQHVVASWNDYAPDPGRNPQHTIAQLAGQLDQPVKALGDRAPEKTFWHCSVRADPGDRRLEDADWADIARRIVRAVGIAPEGDTAACRWVAVRHAQDHIHIAATLVRQDGRRADLKFDKRKAQAEARQIEKDYGLRQLNPGDGTAAKAPTSQERFKAERTGRAEAPRETLREAVRQALAGAATETEFFTRLKDKGLRVKPTLGSSGDVLGYAVALPGDRNAKDEPIWFAGSTLAADLSLPRIRLRFTGSTPDQDAPPRTGGARTNRSAPARGRRAATGVAERAVALLDSDDDGEAAAQLVGIGEVLDAVAQTSPAATRAELVAAARSFERATRSHIRAEQADARALRSAARGIIQAGAALGRARTAAPPRCSCPPWSWPPSPPPAGTPPADTPSKQQPHARPPSTCAPPTNRPPLHPCRPCTPTAEPCPKASAAAMRSPSARHCPTISPAPIARPSTMRWPPPLPRRSTPATTPRLYSNRPSTCVNSTPPRT